MRLVHTGIALIWLAAQSAPPISQERLETQAREAVAQERYTEAREVYDRLARDYPERTDYLIWTGRIAGWMQDYNSANRSFDDVLRREPRNSDALLAKAYVLMYEHQYDEARELLNRAGEVVPGSAEIQLALARNSAYQGHDRDARKELDRALAMDPENKEVRELREKLDGSRVEFTTSYGHDQFSFASSAHIVTGSLSYVAQDSRFSVAYERWDKFNETAHRAGLSGSRRIQPDFWVRSAVMFAPGATVVARHDYTAGASYSLSSRIVALGDYRFLNFSDSRVHVAAPGVEYYLERPISLQATLYHTWTQGKAAGSLTVVNHSASFRYNHQIRTPLTFHAGYARGNESVSALSIDRIGRFQANTFSVGADWVHRTGMSLGGFYAYQRRSNASIQNSVGLSLTLKRK